MISNEIYKVFILLKNFIKLKLINVKNHLGRYLQF